MPFACAVIAHKQSADDPKTARNYGWASCGMAAAGIVATMIIVGVTVGVLLSDQCQYYYVNGVCYRTQSYAATGCNPYNNVNGNKCCSNGEVYIYDGTKGYCYKQ